MPDLFYSRDEWQLKNWGIEVRKYSEDVESWLYPTGQQNVTPVLYPAQNVGAAISSAAMGDFNGDGYQDVYLAWVIFPHTVSRSTAAAPTILWGSEGGLHNSSQQVIPDTALRHMNYRTHAADLNGDGIDDIVSGASFNPSGVGQDPQLAMTGTKTGVFIDVSDSLEGQSKQETDEKFGAHATAVGDLNNDGIDDIFSSRLWISQSSGSWEDFSHKLPTTINGKNVGFGPMSASIGDLNGDGASDLLLLYEDFSSHRFVLLNDKRSELNFSVLELPPAIYSNNSKDNSSIIGDINSDGLNDILIASTRASPYYLGSAIQILVQRSPGEFVDETSIRIDNSVRDSVQGEGELFWIDANGDGHKDIVHSSDGDGVAIYLNDGDGYFSYYPTSNLQPISYSQLDGFQSPYSAPESQTPFRAFPVNDNHDGIIDWLVFMAKPKVSFPDDPFEDAYFALYSLTSTGKEFGRDKDEVLSGSRLDDEIFGLGGNDKFLASAGNDVLDGGSGLDTIVYSFTLRDIELEMQNRRYIVTKYDGVSTDVVSNIERLIFTDTALAIDVDGNAGITAKILGAVAGKESLSNTKYVGVGLDLLDNGMSYSDLAALALNAFGLNTSDQIVTALWTNIVGSAPAASDKAPFIEMLENGFSRGELAKLAAETAENALNIDLVGLSQTGIDYLPVF